MVYTIAFVGNGENCFSEGWWVHLMGNFKEPTNKKSVLKITEVRELARLKECPGYFVGTCHLDEYVHVQAELLLAVATLIR